MTADVLFAKDATTDKVVVGLDYGDEAVVSLFSDREDGLYSSVVIDAKTAGVAHRSLVIRRSTAVALAYAILFLSVQAVD